MEFRIADTFTDALTRLPVQEQKAVKVSAMDLQMNPVSTGLQLHRIEKSKDRNFWSVRVDSDLRIVVHKTDASILLAYVAHHDKAYEWAERRRIEAHPKTGAIQIVEVRERVEDIAAIPSAPAKPEVSKKRCFAALTSEDALSVGVPPDWVADVLAADEDGFLALADHLPAEAGEALLDFIATGRLPAPAAGPAKADFAHPDAMRRFRIVDNAEDLRQALDYPWDKWMVYLHPTQRETIDKNYTGPARVSGSAGTGKTVVALHRAVRLARTSVDARVLLTTFSAPLANILQHKLEILIGVEMPLVPRITVAAFHQMADQLYELAFDRRPPITTDETLRNLFAKATDGQAGDRFSLRFLMSEWNNVIDAWQIDSEEDYAAVPRLGRKNRMSVKQRSTLWPIFRAVRTSLTRMGLTTWPTVLGELTAHYAKQKTKPFTHIVVDESQDLGVAELRFLSSIAPNAGNGLFFAGDLGQRVYQQPFSWRALGINVRGRAQTLKVNYRTSHQIRRTADRLLPATVRDVDGIEEARERTVSAFNGPMPEISKHKTIENEIAAVAGWIGRTLQDGILPAEIGIFVRDYDQLDRARAAASAAKCDVFVLSERDETVGNQICVGTMQLAKGLEFKAVAVMACDDEILPLQARIDTVADEIELDDVYETERQLLYVACTRARDRLLLSCVAPGSEFLKDLMTPMCY